MKKNSIKFGPLPSKKSPKQSINTPRPYCSTLHNVTIADANADDLATGLGISVDRQEELERDIITACKAVDNGKGLTLLQIVALAAKEAQNDNELAFACVIVAEAYARGDFAEAVSELEAKLAQQTGNTTETTTEDSLDNADSLEGEAADNEEEPGFAQFMAAMLRGDRTGALAALQQANVGDTDDKG